MPVYEYLLDQHEVFHLRVGILFHKHQGVFVKQTLPQCKILKYCTEASGKAAILVKGKCKLRALRTATANKE